MKKRLALVLVIAVFAGVLAGCTPKIPTPPDKPIADEEQYLNILFSAEPAVLDVARFLGIADRSVFAATLEPLTRIQDGQIVGAGAKDWDISDDGLTYTFYLRENYWNDGQKVTAADYVSALRRQADPQNAFAFATDYYSITNFEAASKGEADVENIGAIAVDENTLVLELAYKNVAMLSSTDFFPDRVDLAEQHGDALGTEADKYLCCGPFILNEWIHNSELKLIKNEQYWNAENVKLVRVNWLIIPDSNAQLASFENKSIDYLSVSEPEYVEKFQGNAEMSESMISAGRTAMVVFNCEDEILSNQKIRQALSLALDRNALAEVITNGTATPAYSLVPYDCAVGTLNFRANAEEPLATLGKLHTDPKALLVEGMNELGLGTDPATLTLKFSWGGTTAAAKTYAELYQQLWQQALGCVIKLEFNEGATQMSNVGAGNYQMAAMSWGSNYEPQFQLSRWATQVGGQSRWKNTEYNQLVSKASQTVDERERLELYAQAEKMLIEEAAIAPIYFTANRRFSYNYVKGLTTNTFDNTSVMYLYTQGR